MESQINTEFERNNHTAMFCHAIEAVIYIATFIGELMAGNRGMAYVLIVAILAAGPVIGEIIFWQKDHATPMIKHFVAIGFALLYTFVIFTTTNASLYVYAIPIVFAVSVYGDVRYILMICTGTTIESLIVVIGGITAGKFGYVNSGLSLTQITVMILVAVYSYVTVRTLKLNNKEKMERIQEANDKMQILLGEMEHSAKLMQDGVDNIYEKVDKLGNASKTTKAAMEEVTAGIAETAQTAQMQLEQTEEIQKKIQAVNQASDSITQSMKKTLSILENGQKDIHILVDEVETSVKKGADIAEKLQTLDAHMEKMNSIVSLIQGITTQTSLLSLNASIEAARAGEAGKGFAVVASEISGMAVQTEEATVQITKLIEDVTGAIHNVVVVIREMIDGINQEKTSTLNTEKSFSQIANNTDIIHENVEHLITNIEELNTVNQEIAMSVRTISAISEEVSAHATETLEAETGNMVHLDGITEKMQELLQIGK